MQLSTIYDSVTGDDNLTIPDDILPEIRVEVSSEIDSQLLSGFISEIMNENSVVEHRNQTGTSPVICICDWRDLQQNSGSIPECFSPGMAKDNNAALCIVVNMVKGDEEILKTKFPICNIRALFYKDESLEIFRRGFQAVLNNEIWIPRQVLMLWLHSPAEKGSSGEVHNLSARELSVIELIANGMTNKEIAEQLFISSSTVKAHLYNIYKKIDVPNRMQAALWAQKMFGPHPDDDYQNA